MKHPARALVWDSATRLFHWSLLILVSISIYTGLSGGLDEMDLHMVCGYCVLALVLFRLIWGFAGSRHARFSSFVVSPAHAWRYTRATCARLIGRPLDDQSVHYFGHNPLGGYSVVAMLLLLLAQTGTGLFATDDIFIEGPLMHLVTYEQSQTLTGYHHLISKCLMGLIALHVLAVTVHEAFLRERIVVPMISGRKPLRNDLDTTPPVVRERPVLALVLLGLSALFVYVLVVALWW